MKDLISEAIKKASADYLKTANVKEVSELTDLQKMEMLNAQNVAMATAILEASEQKAKEQTANAIDAFKSENEKYQTQLMQNTSTIAALSVKVANSAGNPITQKQADEQSVKKAIESIRQAKATAGQTKGFISKSMLQKAVTTTSSVVNNDRGQYLNTVGQLATRRQTFLDFLEANAMGDPIAINANGKVKYTDWDEATKVRAAAMRAEGAVFPESTAAFQDFEVPLKEVADTIPWTKEFAYDDNFLLLELRRFILTNMRIIKGAQVVNGDGIGNNITGIMTYAPAYVATAEGVVDASIYDLIPYVRADAEEDQGSKYSIDFAVMNIRDILKYKLKKDANNNYIMPPFVTSDGRSIDSVLVIEDNNMVENTMVMGDSRYMALHNADGLNVEEGWINDDFTRGQRRMRGYERLLFLIRNVDSTGFRKVTSISASLTTLGL